DVYGNLSRATSTFSVDDVPPTAPVLTSATATGNNVTVQWTGSPDSDVAGYLVYRNGAPANVPDSFTSLSPYLLPPTTRLWVDLGRPDGRYTYQVQAMDVAGNLSALSNAIDVQI